MTYDDEEYDYDEEDSAEEYGPCPECKVEMPVEAEMCPHCGHWLSTTERHRLWDAASTTKAGLSVGKVLLVIILVVVFLGSVFGML